MSRYDWEFSHWLGGFKIRKRIGIKIAHFLGFVVLRFAVLGYNIGTSNLARPLGIVILRFDSAVDKHASADTQTDAASDPSRSIREDTSASEPYPLWARTRGCHALGNQCRHRVHATPNRQCETRQKSRVDKKDDDRTDSIPAKRAAPRVIDGKTKFVILFLADLSEILW